MRSSYTAVDVSDQTKLCTACGAAKSHTAFNVDSSASDGLYKICKGCRRDGRTVKKLAKTTYTKSEKGYLLTTLLKDFLGQDDGQQMKQIVNRLVCMATEGDLGAIKLVFDRVDGLANQKIELKNDEINPITFVISDSNTLISKLRGFTPSESDVIEAEYEQIL